MSVLIKGMRMQNKCIDCPFMVSTDDDNCILQSEEANSGFETWDEMKKGCPLVEVPEKHGDLIDREVIKQDLSDFYNGIVTARRLIDAQDVVIEAEGGEE